MISSHILPEMELLADDIGIIDQGILLEESSLAELEKRNKKYVHFILSDAKRGAQILEQQLGQKEFCIQSARELNVFYPAIPVSQMIAAFVEQGLEISEAHTHEESLEEYFKEVTGGEGIA